MKAVRASFARPDRTEQENRRIGLAQASLRTEGTNLLSDRAGHLMVGASRHSARASRLFGRISRSRVIVRRVRSFVLQLRAVSVAALMLMDKMPAEGRKTNPSEVSRRLVGGSKANRSRGGLLPRRVAGRMPKASGPGTRDRQLVEQGRHHPEPEERASTDLNLTGRGPAAPNLIGPHRKASTGLAGEAIGRAQIVRVRPALLANSTAHLRPGPALRGAAHQEPAAPGRSASHSDLPVREVRVHHRVRARGLVRDQHLGQAQDPHPVHDRRRVRGPVEEPAYDPEQDLEVSLEAEALAVVQSRGPEDHSPGVSANRPGAADLASRTEAEAPVAVALHAAESLEPDHGRAGNGVRRF